MTRPRRPRSTPTGICPGHAVLASVVLAASVFTACGGDGSPSDGAVPASTTSVASSRGDAPTTSAAPEDHAVDAIEVTVVGTEVLGGGKQDVALGDVVTIRVTVDRDDEVHVHGYDISTDVLAGQTAEITFTADIPGQFEVELEHAGLPLVELVVR